MLNPYVFFIGLFDSLLSILIRDSKTAGNNLIIIL
jgi:hypothetical protein